MHLPSLRAKPPRGKLEKTFNKRVKRRERRKKKGKKRETQSYRKATRRGTRSGSIPLSRTRAAIARKKWREQGNRRKRRARRWIRGKNVAGENPRGAGEGVFVGNAGVDENAGNKKKKGHLTGRPITRTTITARVYVGRKRQGQGKSLLV